MNEIKEAIHEWIGALNAHKISDLDLIFASDSSWISMDGKEWQGKHGLSALWSQRWQVFPDFQIISNGVFTVDTMTHVHLSYTGSAGLNKSIDASFRESVVWVMEWKHREFTNCREYGNPLKMRELESNLFKLSGQNTQGISGLGGAFFKAKDPSALAVWYDEHLGTTFGGNSWSTFKWRERHDSGKIGRTEFSIFKGNTDYFAPSESPFMFNFRVYNLELLLGKLLEKGVTIVGETMVFEYGKFAWIMDPEGNKIELWEPLDEILEAYDAK